MRYKTNSIYIYVTKDNGIPKYISCTNSFNKTVKAKKNVNLEFILLAVYENDIAINLNQVLQNYIDCGIFPKLQIVPGIENSSVCKKNQLGLMYRLKNKEKIKEYSEAYREKNRDRIRQYTTNQYKGELFFCKVCNKTIKYACKWDHVKQQNHKNIIIQRLKEQGLVLQTFLSILKV